ncbi:hypothetical protein QZH41_000647 [Actinostola sp. cb2023]|nr:hypothetical protein QZH41_000647 [Actinostola sp. cb2023]
MATFEDLFESDDEEEFLGFTRSDVEEEEDASGESDVSVDEGSNESDSSDSESENEDEEWSDDLREVTVDPFNKPTGPKNILPAEATAGVFFNQVFPDDLIDLIVRETNLNAQQKQQKSGIVDKDWSAMNNDDIKAYLAIRFIQGIKSLPSERHYWSNHDILGVKKVKNIMPRNRYCKINTYLHFNDSTTALPREHDDHDKLHHIRPLITRLSDIFLAQYMPNRENAIDEGLVKFKGRLGFKQYMPMKPIKRGIKVWMRADSISHFVCQFQVYTGRPRGGAEHGLGERVVKDLSRELVDGHYHLYFDNFFSSYHLMKSLLDDGIYATATTRPNRKEFPLPLKQVKLRQGESITLQKNGVTACSWQDKRKVNFLTTNCQPTGQETVQRRQRNGTTTQVNAPPCVASYNKFMGGVDYADQKRGDYKIPIKSHRWYWYLAFFFIETAAVNAFILRQLSPNHASTTHLKFRLELIKDLLGNYSSRKRAARAIEVRDGRSHFPVKVALNRCMHCAKRGERRRSSWGCSLCDVTLCIACFEPFHLQRQ